MKQQQPDNEQDGQTQPAQKRRPWWKRPQWLVPITMVMLLLALAAVITFIPFGDPATGDGLQVNIEATKMESRNNFSCSSITSSGGQHTPFRCHRLAVINQSNHLLIRRALPQVVEQLRKLPMVQSVVYIDANKWPSAGEQLCDFYIIVDMPEFKETGLLATGQTIDATITTSASGELWSSKHHVFDGLNPPQMNVSFSGTLDHHSVTTGYESASARYKQPSADVAKQLAGKLTKNLTDWSAKHGAAGDLPESLYPPYKPVPNDLPLLELDGVERRVSGRGLMVHNLTVWQATSKDWLPALEDLQKRLTTAGWKVRDHGAREPSWAGSFRAVRDGDVMEGFRVRGKLFASKPTGPQRIVIKYTDRMSRADLDKVLDQLLDDNVAPNTLAMLERNMNRNHRDRLGQRVIECKSTDPALELLAARYLHEQNKNDAALARLDCVWFLSKATGQGLEDEVKKLAKDITEDDDWKPAPPDGAMLQKLGIKRQQSPDAKIEGEVDLNEPFLVYLPALEDKAASESSNEPRIVMVRVERSKIPEGVYSLVLRQSRFSGDSSQSITTPHHPKSPFSEHVSTGLNRSRLSADVQETTSQRFKVTLHIHKPDQ